MWRRKCVGNFDIHIPANNVKPIKNSRKKHLKTIKKGLKREWKWVRMETSGRKWSKVGAKWSEKDHFGRR